MKALMETVGEFANEIDGDPRYNVHTILVVLNGQHGNYDVRVEATGEDYLEDHAWEGIAHPHGGMHGWHKVPEKDSYSLGVSLPRV